SDLLGAYGGRIENGARIRVHCETYNLFLEGVGDADADVVVVGGSRTAVARLPAGEFHEGDVVGPHLLCRCPRRARSCDAVCRIFTYGQRPVLRTVVG